MSSKSVDLIGTGISVGAEAKARVGAKASVAVRAAASIVAGASVSETIHVMEKLLAEGQIEMPGIPENDSVEVDDGLEDAAWSEVDCSDDDAEPVELETPYPRHVFAIRIAKDDQGRIRCEPPYSEWSGAVAKTGVGVAVLKSYGKRLRAYRAVAEFLVKEHAGRLEKGPGVLRLGLEQKAFVEKQLTELGVGQPEFSRFLGNCDLVWDKDIIPGGASMPIRHLFQS